MLLLSGTPLAAQEDLPSAANAIYIAARYALERHGASVPPSQIVIDTAAGTDLSIAPDRQTLSPATKIAAASLAAALGARIGRVNDIIVDCPVGAPTPEEYARAHWGCRMVDAELVVQLGTLRIEPEAVYVWITVWGVARDSTGGRGAVYGHAREIELIRDENGRWIATRVVRASATAT